LLGADNGCSLFPREKVRMRGNRVPELQPPLVDRKKHSPDGYRIFETAPVIIQKSIKTKIEA
jgi:hypothetical protein